MSGTRKTWDTHAKPGPDLLRKLRELGQNAWDGAGVAADNANHLAERDLAREPCDRGRRLTGRPIVVLPALRAAHVEVPLLRGERPAQRLLVRDVLDGVNRAEIVVAHEGGAIVVVLGRSGVQLVAVAFSKFSTSLKHTDQLIDFLQTRKPWVLDIIELIQVFGLKPFDEGEVRFVKRVFPRRLLDEIDEILRILENNCVRSEWMKTELTSLS